MKHFQPRPSHWAVLSVAALALTATACTERPDDDGPVDFGDELAASIYCGDECRDQLALAAAADSIDCAVGVSWSSASFPYGAKSTGQIPEFAAQFFPNMDVTVTDGQGDATTQSGQVDEMIAQGIDVLIVSPEDADGLAGAVDRATEAGIEVIAADRSVATTVATYIGSDNIEAGQVAGAAVAADFPDGAAVVELAGSLGASPTIDRGAGFLEAVEGTGVELIATQTADYDRAEGLKVMEDFLQRFGAGEIDAVYAHNDQMAFGAIQAIKEAGREGEIKVYGVDGEPEALDLIEAGDYQATVAYPLVVKESVIAAAKLCAGEEIDERIVLDSTLINAGNVADYTEEPPQ